MAEREGDIQGVLRCAQVLRYIATDEAESASALAIKLRIGRSTMHRYLQTMARADLIQKTGEGKYAFGPLAAQIGTTALRQLHVVDLASDDMDGLCRFAGETVVLSVWGGQGPVVAHNALSKKLVEVVIHVGTPLPGDSAQGRIFHDFLPSRGGEDPHAAKVSTESKPEEPVKNVQADIYVDSSYAPGLTTMAAPVFDANGIVATIGIVCTTASLNGDRPKTLSAELKETSDRVSNRLGANI